MASQARAIVNRDNGRNPRRTPPNFVPHTVQFATCYVVLNYLKLAFNDHVQHFTQLLHSVALPSKTVTLRQWLFAPVTW